MSVKSRVHRCLDDIVQSSLFSCYCVQLYAMVDKKSHPVRILSIYESQKDRGTKEVYMYLLRKVQSTHFYAQLIHIYIYTLKDRCNIDIHV